MRIKILAIALMSILIFVPGFVKGVSYYDLIKTELDYCESNNGKIVRIENGEVKEGGGCPGCFCQFNDGSICAMEHLPKMCDKGQYKNYYYIEDVENNPDLIVSSGPAGYVISNPQGKEYYIIERDHEKWSDLRAGQKVYKDYFGIEGSNLNEGNYWFMELSICNSSENPNLKNFALLYNDVTIKTWNVELNKDNPCIDDLIYFALEYNDEPSIHEFRVESKEDELSKNNNVLSFSISKNGFEYIVHDDYSDYDSDYYVTFDGEKVELDDLNKISDDQDNNNSILSNIGHIFKLIWQTIVGWFK